ncbi:MAG: CYTH domain-containing protein [Candidatus Paceibacterales bacterium]
MEEEKEIRFKIKKTRKTVEAIRQAGYEKTATLSVQDIYYDTKEFDFLKNKKGYRHRKILIEGLCAVDEKFHYKKKLKEKIFEEELTKKDFEKRTQNLLPLVSLVKKRFIFKKPENDTVEIAIDVVSELGDFLEIEFCKISPQKIFEDLRIKESWVERIHLDMTEFWLKNYVETK